MEEMGLREKDTQNIMCKLTVNKHNICVGVYPKDISVTGQNFQDDQMTKNVWWKDNRLGERAAIYHTLLHVLLFLLVWCHESFYFMFKFQAHIQEMVDLKEVTKSSTKSPFFITLVVS
jgi:hypothetical protein